MTDRILFFTIGAAIGYFARNLFDAPKPETKTEKCIFSIKTDELFITGDIKKMELRSNQTVIVTANPVDDEGNATNIQTGTAKWSVSDESIVSIEVNPKNELEATLRSNSTQGAVVVTLNADGDPSESGQVEIFGSADVRVLGNNAVGFDLEFGEVKDGD